MDQLQVHYELFVRKTPGAPWTLEMASEHRAQVVELAETLMDEKRVAAVRVSKETLDEDSREFQSVVISELKDHTYYARLRIKQNGELIEVDARPSDALALALRSDCPIYVSEEVIRIAKLAPSMAETTPEELRRWLEGLNDEDLGRYKM